MKCAMMCLIFYQPLFIEHKMFSFQKCVKVPAQGGRGYEDGGGLVKVDGKVVWGVGGVRGGVYNLDEEKAMWVRVADGGEKGATLAVCGEALVCVGGCKDSVYSKKVMMLRGGRWYHMSDILVGCGWSCVVSVGGGGLVVMGAVGDGRRCLDEVQVFDGRTKTWHFGPSLLKATSVMSAVVDRDQIYVMGSETMHGAVWNANISDLVRH